MQHCTVNWLYWMELIESILARWLYCTGIQALKKFFKKLHNRIQTICYIYYIFIFRLVHDRELQLHDGKRLIRADRYDEIKEKHDKSDAELYESGVLRIHPSFRIVALAESPIVNASSRQWLNSELLSLFLFHEMRPLTKSEEIHIIRTKVFNLISKRYI